MLTYGVMISFGILFVLGVLTTFFSAVILLATIKHKKDKAPLSIIMLNKDKSERLIKSFRIPGTLLFLTGIFTMLQKFAGMPYTSNALSTTLFYTAFFLGIFASVSVMYASYHWYNQFKRFI